MSGAVGLLLGLLVLSYLGNLLVGKTSGRTLGLASGAEYLVLGVLLGPLLLGVVERSLLDTFQPVLMVGAAWLALVAGMAFVAPPTPGHRRRTGLGILVGVSVGLMVAGAAWWLWGKVPGLTHTDRLLLAAGAGCLCSTAADLGWERLVGHGNGNDDAQQRCADFARTSALCGALAMMALFAAAPGHGLVNVSSATRTALTFAIGAVLGAIAALLLGREFRRNESWGLLLGTALLGAGVAVRLGLSSVATTFVMGVTIATLSPHRAEIRSMLAPTERPVLLPVALLAGASVTLEHQRLLLLLVPAVLAARLLAESLRGLTVWSMLPKPKPRRALLALAIPTSGSFTLATALEVSTRLKASAGGVLLMLAVATAIFGELVGWLVARGPSTSVSDASQDADPGRPRELKGDAS